MSVIASMNDLRKGQIIMANLRIPHIEESTTRAVDKPVRPWLIVGIDKEEEKILVTGISHINPGKKNPAWQHTCSPGLPQINTTDKYSETAHIWLGQPGIVDVIFNNATETGMQRVIQTAEEKRNNNKTYQLRRAAYVAVYGESRVCPGAVPVAEREDPIRRRAWIEGVMGPNIPTQTTSAQPSGSAQVQSQYQHRQPSARVPMPPPSHAQPVQETSAPPSAPPVQAQYRNTRPYLNAPMPTPFHPQPVGASVSGSYPNQYAAGQNPGPAPGLSPFYSGTRQYPSQNMGFAPPTQEHQFPPLQAGNPFQQPARSAPQPSAFGGPNPNQFAGFAGPQSILVGHPSGPPPKQIVQAGNQPPRHPAPPINARFSGGGGGPAPRQQPTQPHRVYPTQIPQQQQQVQPRFSGGALGPGQAPRQQASGLKTDEMPFIYFVQPAQPYRLPPQQGFPIASSRIPAAPAEVNIHLLSTGNMAGLNGN
ncbi:hypothetical protein FB45DRAFT_1017108 [Roridomyces roridus]|uniref:Uncharacterized protein n=1 Tax=Roridomyces roridus TaxID=1738132 RepID=A0AAD7FXX5_9AGAR|nr:hypothetical protein FB45DRAFT_1017108 [Roridomyces roridus]